MTLASALHPVAVFLIVTGGGLTVVACPRSGPLLHMAHGLSAAGSWTAFAATVAARDLAPSVLFGAFAVLSTLLWWRTGRRGRRRRSPRALGHKSRQLIGAMIERMTPFPVPGGSRR